MTERTHLDVRFRGETYRITLDHAEMLNRRGHLIAHRSGYPLKITYEVENDRCINVLSQPMRGSMQPPSGDSGGN